MSVKYIILIIMLVLIVSFSVYGINHFTEENSELEFTAAYVSVEEIFSRYPGRKEAEDKLAELFRAKEAELNEKLSDTDPQKHRQLIKEYQEEMNQQRQELIDQLLVEIYDIIEKTAAEKEVDLVFKEEEVWVGGYDLTPGVLKKAEELQGQK